MAMRSATKSSLIMSSSEPPSTYSAWLLLGGMLEELRRDTFGVNAFRHEVMALVAQRADDLGGERLVEQLDDHIAVGVIPGSHRALRDVLPGALAQRLDVGEESSGHRATASPSRRRRCRPRQRICWNLRLCARPWPVRERGHASP